MAHGVLDVVPEDPKIKHVSADVKQPPVEEHGGEQGDPDGKRDVGREILHMDQLTRDQAESQDEDVGRGDVAAKLARLPLKHHLIKEDEPVDDNQRDGYIRNCPACPIIS